ncbi:Protein kinase-like protein [Gracilaria domingensis]|nr:Protein kinase-like protein [Gracilaria domingensis]
MNYVLLARSDDHSILVEDNNKLPTIKYCGDVAYFIGEICCSREDPIIVLEVPNGGFEDTPENCKWIAQSAADQIAVDPPSQTITDYLEKYKLRGLNLKGEKLHAWSRTGWLERAGAWTKTKLNDYGYKVESIEKLQHGTGSCVLMVRVSSGLLFYMKCSNRQGWWNEVKVTQALGEVMPLEFETPFAIDFDLGWMLTRDYGRTLPPGIFETDVDRAKRAMCRWAEIQKKSVSKVEELLERGVPKVDGKALKAGIDQVMENPIWFKAQREGMNEKQLEMYSDELEYKNEYRAYLGRLFDKVGEYNVPLALVHGDFDSMNVIERGEGRSKAFDLSFYLEYWTEYESMERLRDLLILVEEISYVECVVCMSLEFEQVEEHERERQYEELQIPVCCTFGSYMD